MISIGTVKGQEIKKNRDGTTNTRLLQVKFANFADVQTVQYVPSPGEDGAPVVGDMVVVLAISNSFKIAIGVNDFLVPTISPGEKKLYGRDSSGSMVSYLLLNSNLELNGNNDFAVRYSKLEDAFNQLKSDFNNHVHGTGPTTAPSTADITPAKVSEVLLP